MRPFPCRRVQCHQLRDWGTVANATENIQTVGLIMVRMAMVTSSIYFPSTFLRVSSIAAVLLLPQQPVLYLAIFPLQRMHIVQRMAEVAIAETPKQNGASH